MKLQIKVQPGASVSEIVGWDGDVLKVRLNARPEKGRANKELVRLLSKELDIPKSSIVIVRGETSRLKVVELPEGSIEAIR